MTTPIDTAMILAAGRGERMQPLTAARAKPTLPVLGRPLIERIVSGLATHGIRRFAVNAFHRADSVREVARAATEAVGAELELYVEPVLMGSAGSLAAPAARLRQRDLFLLHNGDTLVDVPLDRLVAAASRGSRCLGALLVRPGPTPGYGGVRVRDGQVLGVYRPGEPPDRGAATFLGVSAVRREILDRVPVDRPSELFRDVVLPMVAEGWTLSSVVHEGPWLEFTSPAQYLANVTRLVERFRVIGDVPLPGGAALRRLPDGAAFVADGADLSSAAFVEGGVVLERGARVHAGALIESSLLLEEGDVASGVILRRVVVERGVQVPANGLFENGILSAGPGGDHVFRSFGD